MTTHANHPALAASGISNRQRTQSKEPKPCSGHFSQETAVLDLAPLVTVAHHPSLLIGLRPQVPAPWAALVDAYVRMVLLELRNLPYEMKRVVIRGKVQQDRLQITLRTRPRLDPVHEQRLHDVARGLSRLSMAISPTSGRTSSVSDRAKTTSIDVHVTEVQKSSPKDTATVLVSSESTITDVAPSTSLNDGEIYMAAWPEAPKPQSKICTPSETYRVFRLDDDGKKDARRKTRDADTSKRLQATLTALINTGEYRPLMRPRASWSAIYEEMLAEHVNFKPLIEGLIWPHVFMLSQGKRHRLPPILLSGPPGVGKTHFARSLSLLLNVPQPQLISMAEESNGASLAGSSTFWSNAAPGTVFETLAWGYRNHAPVANPVIVIDEIDKATGDSRFDPLGAMYRLLEVDTAKEFVDQSLPDIVFDASQVRIVATANDVYLIPEPIRSRMICFDVPPLTQAQTRSFIQRIMRQILSEQSGQLSNHLPEEVIDLAQQLSPRQVRIRLEMAITMATCKERPHVTQEDWLLSSIGSPHYPSKLGFL